MLEIPISKSNDLNQHLELIAGSEIRYENTKSTTFFDIRLFFPNRISIN